MLVYFSSHECVNENVIDECKSSIDPKDADSEKKTINHHWRKTQDKRQNAHAGYHELGKKRNQKEQQTRLNHLKSGNSQHLPSCFHPSSNHLLLPQLTLKIRPVVSSDRIVFASQQIISLDSFFPVALLHGVDLCQQIQCVAGFYGILVL